jgi:hypothetical protein
MANNNEASEAVHPTFHEPPAFHRLDCYVIAKELARRVHVARISDA